MNFDRMSAYLNTFYEKKNIPGLGCAVYYKHQPVYEHFTGYADVAGRVPFGPDTLFNLYSATKLITCTAALQLLERGAFKLDDPLYAFMPEYREMRVCTTEDPDGPTEQAARPITIEHLFTMTAGIRGGFDAPAVRRVVAETNGRAPTADVVRAMADAPLMFQPGTHFKYGICHDVLAGLVMLLSGKSFGEYIQENILSPIGMRDTAFRLSPGQEARMAKHYIHFDAKTGKSEGEGQTFTLHAGTEYESGGGGLCSSVRDYILFAQTLTNGGIAPSGAQILRRATIDDMRRNRLSGEALADFAAFGGWSKAGYGYGLGVRTLIDPERNNSLSMPGEFGWDGARGCYVVIDPDAELALFYAQQEEGSRWYEWHGTVRNYAYASTWS